MPQQLQIVPLAKIKYYYIDVLMEDGTKESELCTGHEVAARVEQILREGYRMGVPQDRNLFVHLPPWKISLVSTRAL